jgi:circadian clock protein KaiC
MERKFLKSGIPGLDEILGGGFLDGSITTVGGSSGSGKSTFAMQFLYEGAVKFDEPGIYIAIEESRDSMLFHMSGFDWNLRDLELEKKILFLDYPVYEVNQFMDQYGAIQEIINSAEVKRVVVDSIMPVALYFKDEDERKKGFLKLIENIRRWNTTTFIVSEDTRSAPLGSLPNTNYEIESFTDGWINLYYQYDQKAGERRRSIEVLKMKGVAHSAKPYPAHMDEAGFFIDSIKKRPKATRTSNKPKKKKAPAKEEKPKKTTKRKSLGIRKK